MSAERPPAPTAENDAPCLCGLVEGACPAHPYAPARPVSQYQDDQGNWRQGDCVIPPGVDQ